MTRSILWRPFPKWLPFFYVIDVLPLTVIALIWWAAGWRLGLGEVGFFLLVRLALFWHTRRSEETRRLEREFQEDWGPYLEAADRGEWPALGRQAPPPDDEGPKAA